MSWFNFVLLIIDLCIRSLNGRRFEYNAQNVNWSTILEEEAQNVSDALSVANASYPFNVDNCYLAFMKNTDDFVTCEDALDEWLELMH